MRRKLFFIVKIGKDCGSLYHWGGNGGKVLAHRVMGGKEHDVTGCRMSRWRTAGGYI